MKCFNHQDVDAIGTCRVCSKGLCRICVVDLPGGLACKNSCERALARLTLERHGAGPVGCTVIGSMLMASAFCMGFSFSMDVALFALGAGVFGVGFWWSKDLFALLETRREQAKSARAIHKQHEIDFLEEHFKTLEQQSDKKPD